MFWIILVLSLILSFFITFTIAIQKTTHSLGRLLVNRTSTDSGSGVQDAITPKSQTIRNIIMFIFIVFVFILTTYVYAWYHGIWVIVACFITSSILQAVFVHPGSKRLVTSVSKDMKQRHQAYLNSGDNLRAQAIHELIEELESLSHEDIIKEAKR